MVCGEVNNANIYALAERNSMRMAQLEARYMRTWVRRNRGEDNCLEGHAEPRKSEQSIM